MKIFPSLVVLALLASSCQDEQKTALVAAPLKSDTTFVMQPELPAQEPEEKEAPAEEKEPVEKKKTTVKKAPTRSTTKEVAESGTANGGDEGTAAATQPAAAEPEKKGWSKTAKGAVIGGVVGAGTGAIINKKNRAAGAVIGGVLGAGAGAVIGNEMDKKDGRH